MADTIEPLERWRRGFRVGLAPQLGEAHLLALRAGLASDDPALIQGRTTEPPAAPDTDGWPPSGACLVGYCGWKAGGLTTVGEVETYFARACFAMDGRLGERAGCRHLANWWDETPRDEARRELLAEVELALAGRAGHAG